MKGGRDDGSCGEGGEKIIAPMFPRLHVNDREKGGPRAPPRNKLALYEQLSIPAKRFNSTSLTLPPHNSGTLVPSESSGQGGGHQRSVLSPFFIPPAYSTERVNSRSSDRMNLNTGFVEFERKSKKNDSCRTSNISGHLSSTQECISARPLEIPNPKNSFGKQFGDDDDSRVLIYGNSGIGQVPKDHYDTNRESITPFCPTHLGRSTITAVNSPKQSAAATCNSSVQLQNACDKPMKRPNTTDLKSRHAPHRIFENGKNRGEQKPKATVGIKDFGEKLPYRPAIGEKTAEPSRRVKKILNQEHSIGPVNGFGNPNSESTRSYPESSVGLPQEEDNYGDRVSVEPRRSNFTEVRENGNAFMVRSETSSRPLLGNSNGSPNRAENYSSESGEKVCESLQAMDGDRNGDVSETSMVDSISGMDISPDDVVEVIGQKHFWEARRAIVNQQRVFAVQVFELHRLIKVQKLIARSPNMLLDDNPYFSRSSPKVSTKKLPSEFIPKSQLQIVKQKDEPRRPNQNTESSDENAIEKFPIPSHDRGVDRGLVSHVSCHGPYPGNNTPPTPMTMDNKTSPWCFPPPGNQWLVPVMSPSEGLVYKPYTGPCPPTAGFMAPVYGACGPLSLPPGAGDFMNPAYGVPTSHPQQRVAILSGAPAVPQNYFPPTYGLPVVNPIIPGTMQASAMASEQGNPSAGIRSNGQAEQFSCNMSTQKSETFSCPARKFQSPRDIEFQGSTESSACERAPGGDRQVSEGQDALPLFPLAPAVEALDWRPSRSGKQPGQVIKVVPHNRRSASESAARIFRSIQEERQQFDSP